MVGASRNDDVSQEAGLSKKGHSGINLASEMSRRREMDTSLMNKHFVPNFEYLLIVPVA